MDLSNNEQIETEIVELRKHLKTYRPGEESKNVFRRNEVLFPEHLFIGLFGRTGCGKTSLINSLKFTVSGPIRKGKWLPVANTEKAGGHTLKRVQAHLKGNVSVIDNRGADDLSEEGLLDEVKAQMDGKRGYSQEIKWHNPRGSDDEDEFIDVNNKVGCAVFVFSARDDISQSTKGLHQIVHFLQAEQGRYPVAVITHVDVVVRQLVDTLRSSLIVTGISEIFEVANITDDNEELEIRYQHNLLSLLERCMTDGDEAAVFKHYQQKEQVAKQQREEQQKRDEKQEKENKQRREELQKRYEQEQRSQDIQGKKIAVLSGGLITSATATGAAVGMVLGPVGSVIGAGVGAGIGAGVGVASLVIGKVIADA